MLCRVHFNSIKESPIGDARNVLRSGVLTKGQVIWAVSYSYLAYVFLGEIPGLDSLPIFSVQAASALLAALFLISSYVVLGVAAASKFLAGTWLTSYAIEFIGVSTGLPFGHYAYTAEMSPFIGPVPAFIPFLWCALGYFSLQAAGISILKPAVLMVLLDLSFDPIFSRTLWHWQSTAGPQYFGVPVLNFFGWFLSAMIVFALFWIIYGKSSLKKGALPSRGSAEGIGFYFLFGMTNVASLINGGLNEAAAVSAILFALATVLLWRWRARGSSRIPSAAGAGSFARNHDFGLPQD